MDDDQVSQIENLFRQYRSVFFLKSEPLGPTAWELHQIDVGDAHPIKQAPRRVPIHMTDEVETILKDVEDAGMIRKSCSPWASPVVLVKKKDGYLCFCVDYQKLNDLTLKDAYPLPRVDENLDALAGNCYFTSLDLASGYWQVELAEGSKDKSAFVTKYGLLEWNVMPFGLCNAPATFQRLMGRVLNGLQWKTLVLYLDDVVVFLKVI